MPVISCGIEVIPKLREVEPRPGKQPSKKNLNISGRWEILLVAAPGGIIKKMLFTVIAMKFIY